MKTASFDRLGQNQSRLRRGFTLIELLVVIGIIGLLSTLAGPALVSVFQGSALTQSGQMVQDQLASFRQYAVANNVTVEVRFYNLKNDPTDTTAYYRALQAFTVNIVVTNPELNSSGALTYTKTAISKAQKLPPSIIMDSGAGGGGGSSLSGLFYYASTGWTNLGAGTGTTVFPVTATSSDPTVLNVGTNYSYIAYQIRPDGSTNLPYGTDGTWSFYITLHSVSAGDGLGTLPKNYFMVQIDPIDGHVFFYRP